MYSYYRIVYHLHKICNIQAKSTIFTFQAIFRPCLVHEQLFKRSLHNRQRWITVDVFFVFVCARCVCLSLCACLRSRSLVYAVAILSHKIRYALLYQSVGVCELYGQTHIYKLWYKKKVKLLAFANCKQRNVYMIESLMGSERKTLTHTYTHSHREENGEHMKVNKHQTQYKNDEKWKQNEISGERRK